ncbi:MAG: trypsin-like peptidase domain-containing protein [Kineosporiaceae bacterium]
MPTFDVTPQGGGPAGPPYAGPRAERRGPGWFAVFGSSLAAAVLASGMTVGITSALDDDSPAAAPAATRAQSAPVVPGGSTSSPDWKAVADAVAPSVVAVQVSTGQGGGQGSGVVLDTSGNIVTNNHVVADAEKVVVVLSDGREFDATVVGTDPSTDLAVIRMTKPPKDLTAATLGDSDQVTVGSPVMAIGNPLGLSHTVTTGIVSAVNRPVTAQSQDGNGSDQVVTNAIQTDASINPGNSGGALLDAQGRVIGITSSIATLGSGSGLFPGQSSQSGSIGLGFAIPSNEAKSVSEQLIASDGKTVEHAWLGVQLQDSRVEVDGARRQAAVLGEVTAGSPAAKAGLKKGDAVIAMNDEAIAGADSLVAQVREKRANESVKLTIVRDGKTQDVTVTLGVRPDNVG